MTRSHDPEGNDALFVDDSIMRGNHMSQKYRNACTTCDYPTGAMTRNAIDGERKAQRTQFVFANDGG